VDGARLERPYLEVLRDSGKDVELGVRNAGVDLGVKAPAGSGRAGCGSDFRLDLIDPAAEPFEGQSFCFRAAAKVLLSPAGAVWSGHSPIPGRATRAGD
jgi:hypothetical protein